MHSTPPFSPRVCQSGKIHFGYIYGLGITGCLGTYLLLNLMSQVRQQAQMPIETEGIRGR